MKVTQTFVFMMYTFHFALQRLSNRLLSLYRKLYIHSHICFINVYIAFDIVYI
jgi:hypothetical protein